MDVELSVLLNITLSLMQTNHFTDVITELKRVRDAYYDSIFEDCDDKIIQSLQNQMDHLQSLANNGQEFIVNF